MSAPTRLLIFAGSTARLDEIGEIEGVLKTHTAALLALRVDRTG